jgi:hypothetical protein
MTTNHLGWVRDSSGIWWAPRWHVYLMWVAVAVVARVIAEGMIWMGCYG